MNEAGGTGLATIVRIRTAVSEPIRRWGVLPIFLFLGSVIMVVFAVVAVGASVMSDSLFAGPELVVASPSTDAGVSGVVTITPTTLADDALRVAWGVATACVLAGAALLFWLAARLVAIERRAPIFSNSLDGWLAVRVLGPLVLIAAGGFARAWLTDRIAQAADIDVITLPGDDDLSLWVFDIPFGALLFLAGALAWIWERGARLQREIDAVI